MVNENQHIINRNILLLQHRHTIVTLAKKIGYTRQAVNTAINGNSTSYRSHSLIAAEFNKPMVEIWPELYGVVPQNVKRNDTISHDGRVNDQIVEVN